jgi:dethiobiotin synthetase
LAVPIKRNYTYGNFAKDLNLPTLIVGRAALGTINDCFLTAFYGKALGLNFLGFVLNGFGGEDFSEKDNPQVVEEMTRLPVLFKVPKGNLNQIRLEKEKIEQFLELLGF